MLEKSRYLRLYDLHAWSGILLGFFLYAISFTGTVALFVGELQTWEDPAKRLALPAQRVSVDTKFQKFIQTHSERGTLSSVGLNFPIASSPYYLASAQIRNADKKRINIIEKWHPTTLELLPKREHGMVHWLGALHRNLMIPGRLGRTLVGIAGVIMLVLILTGILIHGRIVTDFFKLRLKRTEKLKWQDTHKVLGIFTLPFTIMIAFTGAFLGVVALLGPLIALIAFQGNTDALIEKVVGAPLTPSGKQVQMISMDEIQVRPHSHTKVLPRLVFIQNYGDENATYNLSYKAETGLDRFHSEVIYGANGKLVPAAANIPTNTLANKVVAAMTPLHYATYGKIDLKWLYSILGISLCVMIATGTTIWVEKRIHSNKSRFKPVFYKRISQLNIGVSMGFPMASVALFYQDKLYIGAEVERLYWTGITYFLIVVLVIVFSLCQNSGYRSMKTLFKVLGTALLGVPIVNALATQITLFPPTASVGAMSAYYVDISLLVLGLLCLVVGYNIKGPIDKQDTSTIRPDNQPLIAAP